MSPSSGRFCIPVEIKTEGDKQALSAMQSALVDFGIDKPTSALARFINSSKVFEAVLQTRIYPILRPDEYFGIHQTWT